MDNNPNAAAASATEATPNTNSNPVDTTPESTAPQAPAQTPEPDEFDKFVTANGGREKVLNKMKQAIGDPEGYARSILKDKLPQTPQSENAQTTQPVQPEQTQPSQPPVQGGMSTEEFMTQQYFESLSKQDKYVSIQDKILNGDVLKEMAKFGIQPMVNGQFNHQKVSDFLDLYAKTVPASAPSEPITATPTVSYSTIEGEMDRAKAVQVMSQGESHPQFAEAVKFMRDSMRPVDNKSAA